MRRRRTILGGNLSRLATRGGLEVEMNKLPNVFMFKSNNFDSAWEQAIKNVILNPVQITFGDAKNKKKALDSVQTIILEYHAIEQIKKRVIHPKFPFKAVDEYCWEFTSEFLQKYRTKPREEQFSYIYYDRLDSQILDMRLNLKDQISNDVRSNRNQAITWRICTDPISNTSPCMQRIWIRYEGDEEVSVHINWRSRDLFGAWQVNLVAVTDMLYREILKPNNCEIARLIDFNDSLHIYETDIDAAKRVIDRLAERGG